jgi:DNA/RNA endonuclease YhcR with UshA esterase domain
MKSWILALLALAGSSLAYEEMTIAEMQLPGVFGPDSSGVCGDTVTVEGIALSSSEHFYAGSNSSFYLIDENGGDYSGVLVFKNQADAFDVFVGDRLRVTGVVSEYRTTSSGIVSNMSEIVPMDPSVDVEVIDYEQPLPDPVFVDMWYLDPIRHDEHVGERYEGMLMEIHDAVVVDISAPPSFRQFTVADPEGNRTIIRTAAYGLSDYGRPPLGSTFEVIKGVIYQVYGNYNVMPRDINDLVLAVGPPIISGTTLGPCGATPADLVHVTANLSDNTAIDEAFVYFRVNGGSWTEYPLTRDLSNPVLFTADLPAQPEGALVEVYYHALDDEGNVSRHPAEGPDAASFPQLYITGVSPTTCAQIQQDAYPDGGSHFQCHEATLSGVVTFGYTDFGFTPEDTFRNYILADGTGAWNAMYLYNTNGHAVFMDQLERGDHITLTGTVTEYNGLTELTNISSYSLDSSGNPVPAFATTLPAILAAPESFESVLVSLQDITVVDSLGYGEWQIRDAAGNLFVLDNLGVWTVELAAGAHMDGLTGMVTYNFNTWKIAPRDDADFVNLTGVELPTGPLGFELTGAFPNPFNPATQLAFQLDRAARVRLEVFNLAGQRVARLVDGPRAAGAHRVTFGGAGLASGVYVARLEAEGRSDEMKLLLLK